MTKRGRPPTMADVARLAGVSPMTVSRAFKPDTPVNEQTRNRIQAAAEELGYVFDSTAAGFSSRRTGFVAVTIPSMNNANFADTVRGLTEALRAINMQILLGYTDYDVEEEERLVEQLLRRRPEAIVVTGGAHTDRCRRLLENAGIPVVETWDLPKQPIDQVVGFSNAAAAQLMVRHFYEQGYRRIGFIGGDTSRDTRGLDRRRGFVDALRDLDLDSSRIIASGIPPINMRQGALAMKELLARWPDTEAVMCVSDLSAFGAMSECQRAGLQVPGDIAIAGFGAYDIAQQAIPPITTIDVSAHQIGQHAGQLIINLLAADPDADHAPGEVRITPQLLMRESSVRERVESPLRA